MSADDDNGTNVFKAIAMKNYSCFLLNSYQLIVLPYMMQKNEKVAVDDDFF
ncbi:MAG: hypothetical protein MI922_07530 [Bacteroidales bacterium]|nr:hypothetical protein [Bacteroidales bacterium]